MTKTEYRALCWSAKGREILADLRVIPRLMVLGYGYLMHDVTFWFMSLESPDTQQGVLVARIMQRQVVRSMVNPDRGVKEGWYRQDRPGIVDWYGDEDGDETPAYFLSATNSPALILEPEFIQQLGHIKNRRKWATVAIASGILEILDSWK